MSKHWTRTLPLMTAMALALAGCGSGGNNLDDPVITEENACTGDDCVSGQFLDDPVSGLNYRCGRVVSVTTATGIFSCPNGSDVTFYLQAKNGKRKITLGSMKFSRINSSNTFAPVGLIQITPRHLVEGGTALDSLETSETKAIRIVNMLRLLQAMGRPEDALGAPFGRIHISDLRKEKIDELIADITSVQFGSGSFDTLVSPVITALGTPLPTADAARARFGKSIHAMQAGVYEAVPGVISGFLNDDRLWVTGLRTGTSPVEVKDESGNIVNIISQRALEAFLLLHDRDGKAIGFGLEWQDETQSNPAGDSIPRAVSEMRLKSRALDLTPVNADLGYLMSGKVKPGFSFTVSDPVSGATQGTMTITSGINEYGFILGHETFVRDLFGLSDSDPVPSDKIGAWERLDSGGSRIYAGSATIMRYRSIDSYLDPAIWKTYDTVASGVGAKPIFPLHLTMEFRNADTRPASGCGAAGCLAGKLDFTILGNGNIVTDLDRDCQALEGDGSLRDVSGTQEYRLGTVSALLTQQGSHYLSPLILVPRIPGLEPLYGLQLGMTTSVGGKKIKIGFDNALNNEVVVYDNESENSVEQAEWRNYIKIHRYSQTHPENLTAEMPTAYGKISRIAVQSCYAPAPKP